MIKNILLILVFLFVSSLHSQIDPLQTKDSIAQQKWVDSIVSRMSVDQKIGQLFMIAAYSNKGVEHERFISNLIDRYHIGALIFFQDNAIKQAVLTNKYQSISKIPLLIGIDGEWGLQMRLKNTVSFPYNMALGAVRDDRLIEQMGKQMGNHFKREGIHINFAPVVDVNINPKNPVIGNRSFGEDKINVASKSIAFIEGIQSKSVMACAKHFPGHGDTFQDSHKTLPTVDASLERLESIELYPFRKIIDQGLGSIMVAHLSVPSIEPQSNLPSSLSSNIVTDLLKEKMGFKGLIVTDAMNMKGSANFASSEEINLQAILAGNDLLDVPKKIPETIVKFKKAISSGVLTEERLNESVTKILKTKYWAGLNNYKPIDTTNLISDLNTVEDKILNRRLVANSVTLIKNDNNILPIKNLKDNKIAYVKFGKNNNKTFIKRLNDYTKVDVVSGNSLNVILNKLNNYQTVIIGFHKGSSVLANYKFSENELHWIQEISRKHKVILDVFASPYSLLQIKSFTNIDAVMVSYQNNDLFQDISAQMIFGAVDIQGKLPVNIGKNYPVGFGLHIADLHRLGYSIPEDVGLDSRKLQKIDSVAKLVIDSSMAPGLQVLVARHGKVVYRKSYGYYTYDKKVNVDNNSIYDLASVTKILGGLPMIMKAEEDGRFTLQTTLGELMPVIRDSNKDTLTVQETLSHYAKLKPYIPYYKTMVDGKNNNNPMPKYFQHEKSNEYNIEVAKDLFLRSDYKDSIYQLIADAPQRQKLRYKYSGMPFYLFVDYIEKQYNKPLDKLNDDNFYAPLGATTLTYNPLQKFDKSQIVPTEKDNFFRHQLLHGTVHDEGAAMMGGVSGNAGLFANSNDVAKIMQMYLQKGYYGGKTYLKPETIDIFNSRYYEAKGNRRGLGFDKPQVDPKEKATRGCVSFKSFGHSGYTGTYTFADPETEIVYVFLSNRVYPTRNNNKLGKQNIRTIVQGLIQEAIIE